MSPVSFSAREVRQIAIHAKLLAGRKSQQNPTTKHLVHIIKRLSLFQIDSVNVCFRAHYMPLFSRLGPYSQKILDNAAYSKRCICVTWAHQTCFVPIKVYPTNPSQNEQSSP